MIDTYSLFMEKFEEEQSVKDLRQYYKDLLTSNITAAQDIYQTSAQSAAQQASYDISGAYANYLKQQRNIASQGRLESGYKEEVGDVLQSQFQSAYSQAKAEQAQETTSAYTDYLKNIQTARTSEEKAQTNLTKSLLDRASRASEFQNVLWNALGITNPEVQLTSEIYDPEKGLYPAYAKNEKTGSFELTDFGRDMMQQALLQGIDIDGEIMSFESQLTDEQLETYKQYYSEIMKDVAEITPTTDTKGDYLLPDYDEDVGKTTRLKTVGYIDSLKKPTGSLALKGSDYGLIDFGTKGIDKVNSAINELESYAISVGLIDDLGKELKQYVSDNKEEILKNISGKTTNVQKASNRYKTHLNAVDTFINSKGSIDDLKKLFDTMGKESTEIESVKGRQNLNDLYNNMLDYIQTRAKTKYLGA